MTVVQMKNALMSLIGQKVILAETIHDYVQLRFELTSVLSIFNRCRFITVSDTNPGISVLAGASLQNIDFADKFMTLRFDRCDVEIGIGDNDFVGPEAMTLALPDGSIFAWT